MKIVSSRSEQFVTDSEAEVLGAIRRNQPLTAQEMVMLFRTSPVGCCHSDEDIYAAIDRLSQCELVAIRQQIGNWPTTELLHCTAAGEAALRVWIRHIKPSDLLPGEPMRTKILGFDLLSFDERIEWIVAVKTAISKRRGEIEDSAKNSDSELLTFANDDALGTLRARMDWLNMVMFELIKQMSERGPSKRA